MKITQKTARTRPAYSLAMALLAGLALSPAASAQPRPRVADASGAVYTASNGVTRNEIVAFRRSANGALSTLGAFATGGRGSGGAVDPLQSQHSLLLNEDHRFLFAVNSGSGEVSSLAVRNGGSLSLVDTAPSGGGFPVGLALYGNLLYVLNSGGAGSVSGFRVRSGGRLEPIPGSTRLLSAASAGGSSIDFSPDGRTLAATERLTGKIDLFPIGRDGAAGAPVVASSNGPTPFSLTFTPQGALVVAEAPPGGAALSSYAVQPTGLSVVSGSLPTGFAAACWVIATNDGHYTYTANAGSSQITVASVGDAGALSILGAVSTGAGSVPLDLALTASNRYLYALTAGTGTITEFRVEANGGLSGIGTAPAFAPAAGQNGLAAY